MQEEQYDIEFQGEIEKDPSIATKATVSLTERYYYYLSKWPFAFHFVQLFTLLVFGIFPSLVLTVGAVSHRFKSFKGMMLFFAMSLYLFFGLKELLVTSSTIYLVIRWNEWRKFSKNQNEKCPAMETFSAMWENRFGSSLDHLSDLDQVKELLNETEKLTKKLKRKRT